MWLRLDISEADLNRDRHCWYGGGGTVCFSGGFLMSYIGFKNPTCISVLIKWSEGYLLGMHNISAMISVSGDIRVFLHISVLV